MAMSIYLFYKVIVEVFLLMKRNVRLNVLFLIPYNNIIRWSIGIVTLPLIQPCSIFAQESSHITTYYGVVKDAETGQGLSEVSVYVSNTLGCVTDNQGKYQLQLPKGEYVIIFSCIGYQTEKRNVEVPQKTSTEINVSLFPVNKELSEVRVIAKSKTQKMREVPSSVTILDSKMLQGQVATLNEILNRASGVKVAQQGGLGSISRTIIQGLDGKRIGVFINGISMGSSEEFSFASIPIDAIQFVEIYKGNVPAKLGGEGLGGAINIILKSSLRDYFEAMYEISSYNTHLANFILHKNLSNNRFHFEIGGTFNSSLNNYDFVSPFEQGRTIHRDHDRYRYWQLHGSISFLKSWFNNSLVDIGVDNVYDEIQGGLMNVQNNIQHAHIKSKTIQIRQYLSKSLLENHLSVSLSSNVHFSLVNQVDTSHYCYDFIGNKFKSGSVQGEIGALPNDSHDKLFSLQEMLNINYRINNYHSINWNTTYKYNNKIPEDKLADKYAHYPTSGYPNKVYSITSGISYESSLFDNKMTNELGGKFFYYVSEVMPSNAINSVQKKPEIVRTSAHSIGWNEALAWHLNPFFTLKASIASNFRMPTVKELFGDGMLIYPSSKLKSEKSLNVNIGVNCLLGTSYPTFRVDLNAFYMNVRDMIKLMYSNMNMVHANIGKIRNIGVEGELTSELTSWLSFKGNVTYLDARDIERTAIGGGKNFHYNYRIPNLPYFYANSEFNIHKHNVILKNSHLSLFTGFEFTERFSYNWEASVQNTMIVPRKWIFYIGTKCSFYNRFHMNFEIHNLFNKRAWAEFRYPLPGRTFHLKLRYTI